jgi:hypothetical protein
MPAWLKLFGCRFPGIDPSRQLADEIMEFVAACSSTALSISNGPIRYPALLMMSSERPSNQKYPSSSRRARSRPWPLPLILLALEERGLRRKDGTRLTRARLSRLTLKRLCLRETINQAWIDRVNEPLMKAGWILFDAGTTCAAVKVSVVENWPRAISKRVQATLDQVKTEDFDFDQLDRLLQREAWETTTHLRGPKTRKARRAKTK